MTKNKRFELDSEVGFIDTQKCGGDTMTPFEVVVKLNKLNEENEQLKQAYTQLKHRHSLLHDVCIDAECDRDSYRKDIVSLEKENEELKQIIKCICKDYETHHGMDIRNAEWFTAW